MAMEISGPAMGMSNSAGGWSGGADGAAAPGWLPFEDPSGPAHATAAAPGEGSPSPSTSGGGTGEPRTPVDELTSGSCINLLLRSNLVDRISLSSRSGRHVLGGVVVQLG